MFNTLKSKVITSFVCLVIIPIIIGAVIILLQVKKTQINQIDIIQTQMTKRVAAEFKHYIEYNVNQIKQLTELNELPYENPQAMNEKLMAHIMFNNSFDQIVLMDKDGKIVTKVHRYKTGPVEDNLFYTNSIEYLFPKLNHNIFYGDITFNDETGEPISNISFDIRNPKTNELIGVMIASLRIKPIWNLLANIAVQPGQQIYIIDSQNKLVAHPNPSIVLKNYTYDLPKGSIGKGLLGGKSFIKHTNVSFGNQVFTVISEQNVIDAFKLLSSISLVIFIVVSSTILMSIFLVMVNIKIIVNPINHLANVAKDIESGNLERVAKIYANDEIGDMANAFNKMTQKLKNNNLQLQEFNIGLQQKIKKELEKNRKIEQLFFEQKKFADMGQMINAIAHQWRQPLNNIGLIQQYLYDGFVNADITMEEYKNHSDTLMTLVQNMSTTIDEFRTFFTTGKVKDKFNIITAINEFMKLSSAQLSHNNIGYEIKCLCCKDKHIFNATSINVACSEEELNVLGYSGEFKQVLQNIISNAKDALIENGIEKPMITILVDIVDQAILIKFQDNAGGIKAEALQSIFDPYFTTKAAGKGTGIGLYISKLIIDDHFGGRLSAANIPNGAEFTITLSKESA